MKWAMTEEERVGHAFLVKTMRETEQELRALKAEMFQMEQQRLAVDRQQNLWLLRFIVKNNIPASDVRSLRIGSGEVSSPDPSER